MALSRLLAVAACIALALGWTGEAQARWRVAESEHFVVYADDSERDIARFAEMLERFHAGLELATGRRMETPSSSNRLFVYAVGSQRDVAELYNGDRNAWIGGFYTPRAGGSIAVVQDVRPASRNLNQSMLVLLHEYAHHFFHATSEFAMPGWMSEGGAEFFASAGFPSDGGLELGRPALHRGGELFYARSVAIRDLLDYNNLDRGDRRDAFYGRSWLLYHYLTMSESRTGQLNEYFVALANGASSIEAAEQVFGDLDELERDLDVYMRRRMDYFTIDAQHISSGPVTVRELSDGMDELMPLLIRSKRGVTREQALELVPEIRAVARQFPDDPHVLAALAEAEYDAGFDEAAIAAADRAIALDPSIPNAYVQKGYAMFRQAGEDGSAEAFNDAMAPFSALNRLETDHPLPLMYYYRSFTERGAEPPELARAGLLRASQLAPFDIGLRMQAVTMLAQNGEIALARRFLAPLKANPHDARLATMARGMDAGLSQAIEGEPTTLAQSLMQVITTAMPPAEDDEEE